MFKSMLTFLRPRMTLRRFESAYKVALTKHGPKNAEVIATAMKVTTEALGLEFTAPKEAKNELEKAKKSAILFELKASSNLQWFRDTFAKLKSAMQNAEQHLTSLYERNGIKYRNRATQSNERAKQIEEIQKIL